MERLGLSESDITGASGQGERVEVELPQTIEDLPGALGVSETPEMRELRSQLAELGDSQPEAANELFVRYNAAGEELVNSLEGQEYAKGQVALLVLIALTYRDRDMMERYYADLEDALVHAEMNGCEEFVQVLEAELASAEGEEPTDHEE